MPLFGSKTAGGDQEVWVGLELLHRNATWETSNVDPSGTVNGLGKLLKSRRSHRAASKRSWVASCTWRLREFLFILLYLSEAIAQSSDDSTGIGGWFPVKDKAVRIDPFVVAVTLNAHQRT